VLTMVDNLHYLKALSQMGIDACMHKSSSSKEVVAAIDAIGRDRGGDNVVISMPRGSLERLGEGPVGKLSERETEVLVLAARGLSNERIAEHLYLAPSTVKRHPANIYLIDRGSLEERGGEDGPDGAVDRAIRDHRRGLLKGWLRSGWCFGQLSATL
jgi:two-component system, NarL family, nitrate/nitrite response regulator NarL